MEMLEPHCVRVSILLRLGLQNDDGSFNLKPRDYDEKYEEKKSRLHGMKLCAVETKCYSNGSFNLFGERGTLLGRNM